MGWKYHSPPGWPTPPEDWTPPAGWRPDPAWPAAPDDWQFWVADGADDPTLMFELPDDGPFTSLDELIGHRADPVAGEPPTDPVPDRATDDAVAVPAATDLDPSPQPESALVTAMETAESAPAADLVPPADAAPVTAAATLLGQPAQTGPPPPAPVLAAETALAMDAATNTVWSHERPQPAWPVDPALSAEPGWIAEPAPEPALSDEPPPAWTDAHAAPAWDAEPAASAVPAWADAAAQEGAAVDGPPAEPAPAAAAAEPAPSPDPEPAAASTAAGEPEPVEPAAAPELEPAGMAFTAEPVGAAFTAGPEPVTMAVTSGSEPHDAAHTPGIEPVVLVPVGPVYGPVAATPLTSGIAWPAADPAHEATPAMPVTGVPIAGVPLAGMPAAGAPTMAFAAEPAGVAPPPEAAHVPAHAAGHVPAHAAPARRKPWWVWGLAGAAGLLLCTVLGVGGFLATRLGGSPGAVAEPGATEVGEQPATEPTRQAQDRPIPAPSRETTQAQPQDQVFEGTGPQVVPVELGSTFHTVALTYSGTGPFVVRTVKTDGREIQTLVSAAESYEGVRPLDLGEIRPDAVSIQAEGGWRMVVRPLASAQTFSGTASGVGADVLLIPRTAAESVKVAFDHRGSGKFTVQAIGSDSATLISQEGDFTGETMLPRGTVVVVIDTNGVWTFSRE
ncbi:hypothetical protein [Catellatospora vulcania]|uniref:hypothetical protein n=1 Tax=Catellatospora vulcania TaxID=1460450 RepID=UPI0012D3A40C|nr:hypothetical protein [Catellatospora vulcania]